MKILALQLDIAWEDREANFAKVERMIADASPEPNTLVVLPEMFATGFSMTPEASEPEDGPTDAFLARLAHQYDIALVGGAALRIGEEIYNCALTFGPYATPWGSYRKQRPFVSGGEIYTPGKEPELIQMEGWDFAPLPSFCPFICYDLRFPELFREAARRWKPELYVVIASWPLARAHHWVRLIQARAIENQAYVLGVNRCGTDPYFTFPGRTMLVDWHGEILADAGSEEGTLTASLDLPALRTYREQLRFLDDMLVNPQEARV